MITLDIQDGNFILSCPPRERDFAKMVPGLKYKAAQDAYMGPANWTVATILNGVFMPRGLEITDAVREWIDAEFKRVSELIEFKRSDTDYGITVEAVNGDRLFSWQANDAYFMALSRAVIDTSILGSGKGPKALSALRIAESMGQDVFPLLVVTRPLMIGPTDDVCAEFSEEAGQFAAEVAKWLPGKTFRTLTKGMTPAKRKAALESGADVVIIPWHLLPMHSRLASYGSESLTKAQKTPKELNGRFKSVIFDEAHKALDPSTQITKAMWAVSDEIEYKYFLTNTPMEKAPDELWCLLRGAFPEHFPSSTRYKDRYCHMVPSVFGPDKCIGLRPDTENEWRQIYELMHIERDESYLPNLPRKLYHDPYFVEMEGKQGTAYRSMDQKGLVKVKDLILTATDPLVKRTRLLQLAAATPVLGLVKVKNKMTNETEEQVSITEYTMPSCKVDFLFEVLDKYSEPLIVFMDDRKLLDLCAKQLDKAGVSYVEFKGGMKDRVREAGRHEFQSGKARVALAMFQCAAEGLTLTAAPRTLYLQRDDSSINSTQSEGRTRRIGQEAEVVEYLDCITKDTEEIKVHQNYLAKHKVRSDALGREEDTRKLSA